MALFYDFMYIKEKKRGKSENNEEYSSTIPIICLSLQPRATHFNK